MPRIGLTLRGVVQGVGLRPAVFREAVAAGLAGFVRNDGASVRIEVEGDAATVAGFEECVVAGLGTRARIDVLARETLADQGGRGFRIDPSTDVAHAAFGAAPDAAPCPACLAEMRDPTSRRVGHAFMGCATCGPRFSILEALPYDRPNTAMRAFPLCGHCDAELRDPSDRRFHAQVLACPSCGPALRFEGPRAGDDALASAADVLRSGGVLALRGVGGFQLLVDATDEAAVARLRARKHRPDKPFAVLFADLASVGLEASPTPDEQRWLGDPSAPIVLVRGRTGARLAPSVTRASHLVGAMLPASPLHALLADALARPLVCTSGNLAEEPLCTTDDEARERLDGLYDGLLTHDRPILRALDDSVLRVAAAGPIVLRRARGFVPRTLAFAEGPTVVALGGHLKSAGLVAAAGRAVPTAHVGDLDGPEARDRLAAAVEDLLRLLGERPAVVACDLHPDYGSTQLAETMASLHGVPLIRVQHHHAHVAAVAAEHGLAGPVLGLAWDGTGLGTDGELWGGEALRVDGAAMLRVGRFEPFAVPPGDAAPRDPALVAALLLHSLGRGDDVGARLGPEVAERARRTRPLARTSSSVGRLFDAVAALLGLATRATFEAQAAMALEQLCDDGPAEPYIVRLDASTPLASVRLGPIVEALLVDLDAGAPRPRIAARFHETLAAAAVALALHAGLPRVLLAGGCFQNVRLLDRARARLTDAGFTVYAARDLPPNDGGLALGQAWVAAEVLRVSRDPG